MANTTEPKTGKDAAHNTPPGSSPRGDKFNQAAGVNRGRSSLPGNLDGIRRVNAPNETEEAGGAPGYNLPQKPAPAATPYSDKQAARPRNAPSPGSSPAAQSREELSGGGSGGGSLPQARSAARNQAAKKGAQLAGQAAKAGLRYAFTALMAALPYILIFLGVVAGVILIVVVVMFAACKLPGALRAITELFTSLNFNYCESVNIGPINAGTP